VNAVVFEKFALQKTNELFQQHDVIVMVGGTGLYLKAFCEGLDIVPEIDEAIRQNIIHNYETKGLEWLKQEVKQKDPSFYETGEIQNPQRMMRALEVMEATGQSILSFRKGEKVKRNFNVIKIGLELPREELIRNINTRTDNMMEAGLLNEVRELMPYKKLNALQTVGYKELFDHLHGNVSIDDAVSKIKTNTRQYAKRQMTWFKKDNSIHWFHPQNMEGIKELIKQ
jgi:tRNA dimethylallyltransferase